MSRVEIFLCKNTHLCLSQELICDHAAVKDTHMFSGSRSYVTYSAVSNENLAATAVLST